MEGDIQGMSGTQEVIKVDENKVRHPLFSYQTGKMMYLSRKETILIDCWVKTFNYAECGRQIAEVRYGHAPVKETIKRWLSKPRIAAVVMERLKDKAKAEGYSREKWIGEGRDIKEGLVKVTDQQMMAWKEMGKAMGYYEESRGMGMGVQINFTQGNGEI